MNTDDFARETEERLLRYAAIDTQSDETSPTSPSTERQLVLLHLLRDELAAIGAADVTVTPYGTVLATLPGSRARPHHRLPRPRRHRAAVQRHRRQAASSIRAYDGGTIAFPDAPDLVLSPDAAPTSPRARATTSSPPAARRCSAPTTRPASPSS